MPSLPNSDKRRLQLTDADVATLLSPADYVAQDDEAKRRNSELKPAAWAGMLRAAVEGHAFVPSSRIEELFGKTLQENYPEANDLFLRFATGYWTFKLLSLDIQAVAPNVTLVYLLRQLEDDTAVLFFPTPGPARISPTKRELSQRELLRDAVPELDLDVFMKGNPILIRERQHSAGFFKRWFS